MVRPGPSLKGLFPLERNSCQQLPRVGLRPTAVFPSPPEGWGPEWGPDPEGAGARAGAAASCRGPGPQKHFVRPSPPRGPAPWREAAGSQLSMACLLWGSSPPEEAGICTWQGPHRKSDRGEDAFSGACRWAEGSSSEACCLASSDAFQALWQMGGGGGTGCCLFRPSQPPAQSADSPVVYPQRAGIAQAWGLPGSAKQCILRVRGGQGPKPSPCTNPLDFVFV